MKEKKPVAIVLGGIVPHITLIKNLKNRGYYTVLIDYYENPPAKNMADEHIQESTLDIEKVLEISKERKAELVIGLCVDQANVTACYVSEKLGLPKFYSYNTSLEVTDKSLMKTNMLENNIPTSNFIVVDSAEDIGDIKLDFPLVVKPVDNNGSKGVKRIENISDLKEPLKYALSISRAGKAIIEEFNDGFEIQIDCFVKDQKTEVIMIKKRLKITNKEGEAMQSFGSVIPAGLSDKLKNEITQIATDIAMAFDLNNTPFFIQAIVKENKIKVLEFAPRIGGATSFVMIKMVTGFDILNTAIETLLEIPGEIKYHEPQGYTSTIIYYAKHGTFKKVTGYQNLVKQKIVTNFYITMTEGMKLGTDMDSRNRVGSFIITADTKEELLEKANLVLDTIEVYDMNDNPIMRRDLYPTIEIL